MDIDHDIFYNFFDFIILANVSWDENIAHEVTNLKLLKAWDVGLFKEASVDFKVDMRDFGDQFLVFGSLAIFIERFLDQGKVLAYLWQVSLKNQEAVIKIKDFIHFFRTLKHVLRESLL